MMSTSTIQCVIDIFVKPESVEKVRTALLKLVEYSCNEEGCLHYKLYENINDQFQFTIIETWTNDAAFEDHLQSEHVRKASFNLNDDLSKAPDIKRYKSLQFNSNKMKNRTTSRFCALI